MDRKTMLLEVRAFLLYSLVYLAAAQSYPKCPEPYATCASYGVDFQNNGAYFLNTNSTDPFTFVSQFEGCQNDIAQNILVDPYGNEYLCSNTTMQPPDTNEMSTCNELKENMFDGEWSVLIISNNGQCAPIAYERDFYISAGPQQTTTYTPTIVFTSSTTPVITTTSTYYQTITTTLAPPYTTTLPSRYFTRTTTITPAPSTSTSTIALPTVTIISWSLLATSTVSTHTETCKTPRRATTRDPIATIVPTLLSPGALFSAVNNDVNALLSALEHLHFPRTVPVDRAARASARRLHRRAPDPPTVTLTDTNPADYVTSIATFTASAVTDVVAVSGVTTSTSSLPPATVYSGVGVVAVSTTLLARTYTRTVVTAPITTVVKTSTFLHTVVSTVVPPGASISCRAQGGTLV